MTEKARDIIMATRSQRYAESTQEKLERLAAEYIDAIELGVAQDVPEEPHAERP
jgi:hypothetical protein